MMADDASSIINEKMKFTIEAGTLGKFERNSLKFDLVMCIEKMNDNRYIPVGEKSNWLWMTTEPQTYLLMSFSLWNFLKKHSHEDAYGSNGNGYNIEYLNGNIMVVVKKIAIDVEEMQGRIWNPKSCLWEEETYFRVPFGTEVNVGEYSLAPYKNKDEYGFQNELFTKWRKQISADFFGVHYLQNDMTRFAMIPSVVVQFAAGVSRHYNEERELEEEKNAEELVCQLRSVGLHARDVHSEHHGIVIMNKSPEQFVDFFLENKEQMKVLIEKFKMAHWIASYMNTFNKN